jgi:hypothetical protein
MSMQEMEGTEQCSSTLGSSKSNGSFDSDTSDGGEGGGASNNKHKLNNRPTLDLLNLFSIVDYALHELTK